MAVVGLASQTQITNVGPSPVPGAAGSAFLSPANTAAPSPYRATALWTRVLQLEGMPAGQATFDTARALQLELQQTAPWPEDTDRVPTLYQLLARVTAVRNRSLDVGGVVTSGGLVVAAKPTKTEDQAWREGFVEGLGDGARNLGDAAAAVAAAPGKAVAGALDVPEWVVYGGLAVVALLGVLVVVSIVRG